MMKNNKTLSLKRLSFLISQLPGWKQGEAPNEEEIERLGILDQFSTLNWSIEAMHIRAWNLHRPTRWTSQNWQYKILNWGRRTTAQGRRPDMMFASRTPTFLEARREMELLFPDAPPPKAKMEFEEEEELHPESIEELMAFFQALPDNAPKIQKDILTSQIRRMRKARQIAKEQKLNLIAREQKFILWSGYQPGKIEQTQEFYGCLNLAFSKGWFSAPFTCWLSAKYSILGGLLAVYAKPKPAPERPEATPQPEATQPPEEGPKAPSSPLYSVLCKIPPHKMTLMAEVLGEEGQFLRVFTNPQINGANEHKIPKNLARKVKEEEVTIRQSK